MALASPRQWKAIRHGAGNRFLFAALGEARSGKTSACIAGHSLYTLHEEMATFDHGVIGVTEGSIRRNLLHPPINYLSCYRAVGLRPFTSSVGGFHIVVPLIDRILRVWMIGGSDTAAAIDRIAGGTWGSLHFDEGARIPEAVWDVALSRLSSEDAKGWTGLNAEGKNHWWRERFILNPGDTDVDLVHYKMTDNPVMGPKARQRMRSNLRGHMLRRLGYGEWCDAAGLICPVWHRGAVGDGTWGKAEPMAHTVGVAWSAAGTFGAILAAHPGQDRKRGVVITERQHDPEQDDLLLDSEQADRTRDWIAAALPDVPPYMVRVIGGSGTPAAFRSRLQNAGFQWTDADDADELGGLQAMTTALGSSDYRLGEDVGFLAKELDSYLWDAEWAKKGKGDRPADMAAPMATALRHVVHAPPVATELEDAIGF